MMVKPLLDVVEFICPVCWVGNLTFGVKYCPWCNCELDWSGIVAEVDSKTGRYRLL